MNQFDQQRGPLTHDKVAIPARERLVSGTQVIAYAHTDWQDCHCGLDVAQLDNALRDEGNARCVAASGKALHR